MPIDFPIPPELDPKAVALGGLFSDFPGYQARSAAESQAALRLGLVICDANVLLNLYRYDDTARTDFFAIMASLGDRLFVPHQALYEFWGN